MYQERCVQKEVKQKVKKFFEQKSASFMAQKRKLECFVIVHPAGTEQETKS